MKRQNLWLWLAMPAFILLAAPSYWFYLDRLGRTLLETHNEGWVAYFADRAISGPVLYPQQPSLILNNYPPLSFYLIGGLGRLLGNTILAGRILSLVALAVLAMCLALLVRPRNRSMAPGLFAGVFFLAFFAVYPGGRIGLNDPELLAHAIMAVALVVLNRFGATLPGAIAAAGVMALAGLTKHNLIAIPLGVLLWAALSGWIVLRRWLVAMLIAGISAAVLLWLVWGPALFASLLVPRELSLMQGITDTRHWLDLASLPLFIVVAAWIGRRWDIADRLPFIVVAMGVAEIVLFSAGIGVNSNIAYDLVFALSWALGMICARAESGRVSLVVAGGLVLHLLLAMPMEPLRVMAGMAPAKSTEERGIVSDLGWLRQHPGRTICMDLALCYYAGRDFEYDRFNLGQLFSLGRRDPKPLFDAIAAQTYAVIELDQEVVQRSRSGYPANLLRVIQDNYTNGRETADRVFLLPKPR